MNKQTNGQPENIPKMTMSDSQGIYHIVSMQIIQKSDHCTLQQQRTSTAISDLQLHSSS